MVNSGGAFTDNGGVIDADPLFVRDPDLGDGDWTTSGNNDYGDLRLQFGSPAVDAGTNSAIDLPTDLNGDPRIINGIVDMGAYEAWLPLYLPLVLQSSTTASTSVTAQSATVTQSHGLYLLAVLLPLVWWLRRIDRCT